MNKEFNAMKFIEFLAWERFLDSEKSIPGLTIPPLVMHNFPLCAQKQPEEGLCMLGNITTKEKCPVCKKKFENINNQALICKEHFTFPERYYIALYWGGKQRKIYSDNDGRILNNYELANRVLIEIRQKIDKHRFDPADYVAKDYKALQFDKFAEFWLQKSQDKVIRNELAYATYMIRKYLTHKYFIPHFKNIDIRDIRIGNIDDFKDNLPARLKISTRKNILIILHAIFSYAKWRQDIKEIPRFPVITPPESPRKWLDENQQRKVLSHIPDYHKPIFLFMMKQGVRPGEARALHWEDIDLKNRAVTICRSFSDTVYQDKTKTKKIRVLPLDDEVYEMLIKIRGIAGFVFKIKRHPYKWKFVLTTIWKKAIKKAGLQHCTLYEGTRHSFGSQCGNSGVEAFQLQKFLGHTKLETTQKYVHINTGSLQKVLAMKNGKILKFKRQYK